MKIAIDYDDTYTLDPEGWELFICLMQGRGHEVVCITKRYKTLLQEVIDTVSVPVIGASRSKMEAARMSGHKVDVWIDDKPETITPQKKIR
jgi:Asp/Glu/hydantoin racemase